MVIQPDVGSESPVVSLAPTLRRLARRASRLRVTTEPRLAELRRRQAATELDEVRRARYDEMVRRGLLDTDDPVALRYASAYAPGSFYSGIPGTDDVAADRRRRAERGDPAPGGIDADARRQLDLLADLAAIAPDLTEAGPDGRARRYRPANGAYDLGDATVLVAMLGHLRPRRVIEVGSGWSTAALLDGIDGVGDPPQITCIEPYPALVREILRPDDLERIELRAEPVQDLDVAAFADLGPGDVLFLDTTHVVKPGSDVIHHLFHVLPTLAAGVWVHLHDMPWPFQSARAWEDDGRIWAECYQVGSFLQFNRRFSVRLFVDQLAKQHPDEVARIMPALAGAPGGSLWLEVVEP